MAGAPSSPYDHHLQDSPPYGQPYPDGMPPGQQGQNRTMPFPPGQHQLPGGPPLPGGYIPPEASGGMPGFMGGGFRPPGMPPNLRLPPPGPLSSPPPQHKRSGRFNLSACLAVTSAVCIVSSRSIAQEQQALSLLLSGVVHYSRPRQHTSQKLCVCC